jgi:hypothetical protein
MTGDLLFRKSLPQHGFSTKSEFHARSTSITMVKSYSTFSPRHSELAEESRRHVNVAPHASLTKKLSALAD